MAPTPKPAKRKPANLYQMPEKVIEGTILTTLSKKQFRVGKAIGSGGFGEIYLCSEEISKPVGDDANRALKIEPHENGPLFVEMNFYIRAASPEAVDNFKKERGFPTLGMPCHRGSGSTDINGKKHRFLVMDRFGKDLEKLCLIGKSKLSEKISYNLAIRIVDVLEYIHHQGYIHNDIKAQNLLTGYGKKEENNVFVVDFGLVTKYMKNEKHVIYAPDPKKAHNGTIEYLSRDAHIGALGRRSDFEVLGYNLVHWMSGTLPWMNNLGSPEPVHTAKKKFMSDIPGSLKSCFGSSAYPEVLEKYLSYVESLKFDAKPDYDKIRQIFKDALKKAKCPLDGKLDFSSVEKSPAKAIKKTPLKVRKTPSKQVQCSTPSPKSTPNARRKPLKRLSKSPVVKEKHPKKRIFCDNGTQTSPAFVTAAKAAKKAMRQNKSVVVEKAKPAPNKTTNGSSCDFSNPTPAMASLLAKRAAAEVEKGSKKRKPSI